MIESGERILASYLDAALAEDAMNSLTLAVSLPVGIYDRAGTIAFSKTLPDATSAMPPQIDTAAPAPGLILAKVESDEGHLGYLACLSQEGANNECDEAIVTIQAKLLGQLVAARRAKLDLSTEILSRYEEISLIYAVAGVMNLDTSQSTAINFILETAAETLAADFIFVTVPAIGLFAAHALEVDCDAIPERLRLRLAAAVTKSAPSVALNNLSENSTIAEDRGPFEHAVTTYIDVDGSPGAMGILRTADSVRFGMGELRILESIARQVSILLSNQKIARARQQLFDAVIFGLARLAESRDPETGEHLERVSFYCGVLGKTLSAVPKFSSIIDEQYVDDLQRSSPLHDIGKVGIPDAVLLKPGKLTDDEFVVMRTHAIIGGDTLRDIESRLQWGSSTFLTLGREIAYAHHEKWDGSGYPYRLAGETIPLAARIMALADVFDALTSRRCYKDPMPYEQARGIIVSGRGSHFDPDIVDAYIASEGAFKEVLKKYADGADHAKHA